MKGFKYYILSNVHKVSEGTIYCDSSEVEEKIMMILHSALNYSEYKISKFNIEILWF